MKRFYFEFILTGVGNTSEEALGDAIEGFLADPGEPLNEWDEPFEYEEEVL